MQAIHAVAALDDAAGVEMLFTADEEVGSESSRDLLEELALACGNVLVLEPSADGGKVKTGRKGTGTFEVVVRGRAAHAGLEPEKGVNALVEAAYQVLTIDAFGDVRAGTTVTPTVAHVGSADNVVQTYTINLSSEALNGTWKLRVNDNAVGDTGYINSWSITF